MRHSLTLVATLVLALLWSTSARAVERTLVNETKWKVSPFGDSGKGLCTGPIHPVPWTFHRNGKVNAGEIWSGTWTNSGDNKVHVEIQMNDGSASDDFDVVFVSSQWFVGVKGKEVFRMGMRSK